MKQICKACQTEFTPKNIRQEYCDACIELRKKKGQIKAEYRFTDQVTYETHIIRLTPFENTIAEALASPLLPEDTEKLIKELNIKKERLEKLRRKPKFNQYVQYLILSRKGFMLNQLDQAYVQLLQKILNAVDLTKEKASDVIFKGWKRFGGIGDNVKLQNKPEDDALLDKTYREIEDDKNKSPD